MQWGGKGRERTPGYYNLAECINEFFFHSKKFRHWFFNTFALKISNVYISFESC